MLGDYPLVGAPLTQPFATCTAGIGQLMTLQRNLITQQYNKIMPVSLKKG